MPEPAFTDFIVLGSGIAGLRAAIALAPSGRVALFTKDQIDESNTQYAQGGIAVVLSDDDRIELHVQDTLDAGAGLCDEAAVKVLVEEGPRYILELIDHGAEFDREEGDLAFTREAAHSRRRILHAHGDSTGREIGRALLAWSRKYENIEYPRARMRPVARDQGRLLRRHDLRRPGDAPHQGHVRASGRARDGRRGPALRAHDESRHRDRRRHGDGLPRGGDHGGHGVRPVPSDRARRSRCAAIPALGGDARRGRHPAQRGG